MPEKRLIHAHKDITNILHCADSMGLHLLPARLKERDIRPWKPELFQSFVRGTVYLFRPDWVVDGLQLMLIEQGINAGTYVVRPGTNFSPIDLFFHGDEDIAGVRRLGSGSISFKRDWYHFQSHEIRLSPPEVEVVYKDICKHLLSRITVSGGGHRYHVCKEAAELAARVPTRPPFDYIPWPPPGLDKLSKR